MSNVYIIGVSMTHFRRWVKRSYQDLAQEAFQSCLKDSGLEEATGIDYIAFGSCAHRYWKQANIVGQTCIAPWIEEGILSSSIEIHNVEGGCATGSLAAYQVMVQIASGRSQIGLALGVDKTFLAHQPHVIPDLFLAGVDQNRLEQALEIYKTTAESIGESFDPHPQRILLVDIAALHARAHMQVHGVTLDQIASVASKNHNHGSLNPLAQYQNPMSEQEILEDQKILSPLTRSMCAPISDGASAVLMVSETYLKTLPLEIQKRAVRFVDSRVQAGVMNASWQSEGPTQRAASLLYQHTQIQPQEIAFAELHDSTAYSEILHLEELGLYPQGQAAYASQNGHTHSTGRQPINVSGGLISKGHPLGASGLAMMYECVTQLRGEAQNRQIPTLQSPYALIQNGGGLIGFQEATSVVSLLQKTD